MSQKKVTLAHPYVGEDGTNHKPDTTLNLEVGEANRLLFLGLAREADTTTKKG
jgi:hypothetical protein